MNNGLLEAVITVTGTILALFVKDHLDRKKLNNKTDLDKDFNIKKSIFSILEEVKYEFGSDKTFYWVFSNGDVTFSGFHLKKLSILEESSGSTIPSIAHLFQTIPAKKFEDNLSALSESKDDYIILDVEQCPEEMKDLYSFYNVKKILKIKVKDNNGRWIGIMSSWFTEDVDITDGQIAFAKIQASRIGLIK